MYFKGAGTTLSPATYIFSRISGETVASLAQDSGIEKYTPFPVVRGICSEA